MTTHAPTKHSPNETAPAKRGIPLWKKITAVGATIIGVGGLGYVANQHVPGGLGIGGISTSSGEKLTPRTYGDICRRILGDAALKGQVEAVAGFPVSADNCRPGEGSKIRDVVTASFVAPAGNRYLTIVFDDDGEYVLKTAQESGLKPALANIKGADHSFCTNAGAGVLQVLDMVHNGGPAISLAVEDHTFSGAPMLGCETGKPTPEARRLAESLALITQP